MKIFNKKSGDSRSRRNNRLLMLRLQGFGMVAGVLALIGAAGYAGYHNGAFKKINAWAVAQTLRHTANAGFKVTDIIVIGRDKIPAEELLQHLSIKKNAPIFGIDIAEAQKSLADISWIKEVSIARRLPDKIIVELKERTPVALWQYKKKISLIDQEGIVLAGGNLSDYEHLPLTVGEDAPQHVMGLLHLLEAEPAIAQALTSATRIGGRRWDLRLKNGIAVKLPEQDLELALRRLAMAEEKNNIFGRNIITIDLRQPEKMVVTPKKTNI